MRLTCSGSPGRSRHQPGDQQIPTAQTAQATNDFEELQPEVSTHMNFQMAVRSLKCAVAEIEAVLAENDVQG